MTGPYPVVLVQMEHKFFGALALWRSGGGQAEETAQLLPRLLLPLRIVLAIAIAHAAVRVVDALLLVARALGRRIEALTEGAETAERP